MPRIWLSRSPIRDSWHIRVQKLRPLVGSIISSLLDSHSVNSLALFRCLRIPRAIPWRRLKFNFPFCSSHSKGSASLETLVSATSMSATLMVVGGVYPAASGARDSCDCTITTRHNFFFSSLFFPPAVISFPLHCSAQSPESCRGAYTNRIWLPPSVTTFRSSFLIFSLSLKLSLSLFLFPFHRVCAVIAWTRTKENTCLSQISSLTIIRYRINGPETHARNIFLPSFFSAYYLPFKMALKGRTAPVYCTLPKIIVVYSSNGAQTHLGRAQPGLCNSWMGMWVSTCSLKNVALRVSL